MVTKICHKKLTAGNINICTLKLGTTNGLNVLYADCPVRKNDNEIHGKEFLDNCSQYRSMNKRY